MSDSTLTEPLRLLKSPCNGAIWTVPPEVSSEMYDELIKRGFEPVEPKKRKDPRDR